jgi:lysozyme
VAYNKVTYHTAPNCSGCQGINDYWRAIDAAGVPFAAYSVDDPGLIVTAAQYKNATLIFRDVEASTVNPADYNVTPDNAAAAYWAQTIAALPPQIVALKGRVWLELMNEPGREDAQANWVGAVMAGMARRALAQGWRVMGAGWAPGNPEPSAWRSPGWRDYLALCAANPDKVAVSLHEYSLSNDIHNGENWLVGRFIHLFEACDEMKIARPTVYITECGWTLNSAPATGQMQNDIAWMSALYARHPQIKSAHLWTLQGGRQNGDLPGKLNSLMPWLRDWTVSQRWPDPVTPPPPNPPTPTTPVKLIDISKWNTPINPAKIKAAGVDGVMVRASYAGVNGSKPDERVDEYVAQLKAAGLPFGFYHYFCPARPIAEQFAAFRIVVEKHGYQLRLALDLEDENGLDSATAEKARAFAAMMREAFPTEGKHLIYTSLGYWRDKLKSPAWGAEYDLWIAAWTSAPSPAVPAPWTHWTLWQYTSDGNGPAYGVGSARVDLNRFNGDQAAFNAWVVQDGGFEDGLRARAAIEPVAYYPFHALPDAALEDGYYPIGAEFDHPAGGTIYRAIRAMNDERHERIYYAVKGDYVVIRWITSE